MPKGTDIGIDLGTESIVVFVKGKGILIREPSLVAYDKDQKKIVAYGREAQEVLDSSNGSIIGIRPLKRGVISNFVIMENLLQHFLQMAIGYRLFIKPTLTICIPSGVTDVEKRAVEEAAYKAGARRVTLVKETVAAALGAGLDIMKPAGNMIVDIGGTSTDIAVLSLGGVAVGQSMQIGGEDFNIAIASYLRERHNIMVSLKTAEQLKIKIGTASRLPHNLQMNVTGRAATDGTTRKVLITSEDIRRALLEPVGQLTDAVSGVLERTQPDLAADISERGILLVGGGAMLVGMEEAIEEVTGIPTVLAEHPISAVARGTAMYLEKMEAL
ncbi:MAG: rod shape-determining protein [Eubacterium sp.]|nr:rod shape-determining protein [Eubacterium sp.]